MVVFNEGMTLMESMKKLLSIVPISGLINNVSFKENRN